MALLAEAAGFLLLAAAGCGTGAAAVLPPASTAASPAYWAAPSAAVSASADGRSANPPYSVPPSVPPTAAPSAPSENESASSPAPSPAVVLPSSPPVTLVVPALGIDAPLIDLGRNADGTVEVPSLDDPNSSPGWYRNSPTPGSLGPAVILGHVDSREFGPGVFYSLRDLRNGNAIEVDRADGTVAEFTVDVIREVPKADFPTLEVYGNLDHAGLRLITCGGVFDDTAGSYQSNVIVFASLTGSRPAVGVL